MIAIRIKNYETGSDNEFRCLVVYQDNNEIAVYHESKMNSGDWGVNNGQEDNRALLQIFGWEEDDIETHEIARACEREFIQSISLMANR